MPKDEGKDGPEILIVRHGLSSQAVPRERMTAAEFRRWVDGYNLAGIDPNSRPPDALLALAGNVNCIVCSDLPRSLASARRLCPAQTPRASPLFREAGRPLQGDWRVRLPLSAWDRVSVCLWRLGCIACDESLATARARARRATGELADLADRSGRVLLVGHGTLNAMVATELRRLGWLGPRRTDENHWGVSRFVQAATAGAD